MSTTDIRKMKVYLTVDTEVWDYYKKNPDDYDSAIIGRTDDGDYGLNHLLEMLTAHKLHANFFVEPLFSLEYGKECLVDMVNNIADKGHDIQLHLHTEWINNENMPELDGGEGNNLFDFSLTDQTKIISAAKNTLAESGARSICAFRAGNYGANDNTIKALIENGIFIDTSYNFCYSDKTCKIKQPESTLQPCRIDELTEYPITYFEDYPGHFRHFQITACSFNEYISILEQAYISNWRSVVIVLHSFEWIRRVVKEGRKGHKLDKIVLRRFERLCEYLNENDNRFETALFSTADLGNDIDNVGYIPPKSTIFNYVQRQYEQFQRRLFLGSY